MKIYGLTGGIACGKSAISNRFLARDMKVVDADLIARSVVEPGSWGLSRVISAFGDGVLKSDGSLDRKKLGRIIFLDETQRWKLGGALGLPIASEIIRQLAVYWVTGELCVILDAPTLYETKSFVKFCSRVIVVSVSDEIQLKRLMKRDRSSKKGARMRIDSQVPLAKKIELCDIHIVNNGTLKQLNEKVDQHIAVLRKDSNTIWERIKSPASILIATYFNIALFSFSLTGVWPLVFVTCCVGLYTTAFYMKIGLNRNLRSLATMKNVNDDKEENSSSDDMGNGNDADDEFSQTNNQKYI